MKLVILAAGQGTRLRPHTDDLPKTLVPLNGQSLLSRQLKTINDCGITDVAIVSGYCSHALQGFLGKLFYNELFGSTNMVHSLFCAQELFDGKGDVIISYGDIVYSEQVLNTLLETRGDVVITADKAWQLLWQLRMDDPLSDAESFKFDRDNNVLELGKKIENEQDAQAQYIGLIKVSAKAHDIFINSYKKLDKGVLYDGKDVDNLYMTSYLQYLINNTSLDIKAGFINGGWLEVDSCEDLAAYQALSSTSANKYLSQLSILING